MGCSHCNGEEKIKPQGKQPNAGKLVTEDYARVDVFK